jgi:phi LC3 family holin
MVMEVVQLVIGVFVLLGIVVDPTTKGIDDSARAMTYEKPADDQGVA